MDISKIGTVSEDEGTFVHFKDAAGLEMYDGKGDDATPIGAVVAGTYSKSFKDENKKQRAQSVERARLRANAQRPGEAVVDEVDESVLKLQVACIRSWTFEVGDKPFPVTLANWKALLAMQPQWQEQVAEAMQAHERFFKAS